MCKRYAKHSPKPQIAKPSAHLKAKKNVTWIRIWINIQRWPHRTNASNIFWKNYMAISIMFSRNTIHKILTLFTRNRAARPGHTTTTQLSHTFCRRCIDDMLVATLVRYMALFSAYYLVKFHSFSIFAQRKTDIFWTIYIVYTFRCLQICRRLLASAGNIYISRPLSFVNIYHPRRKTKLANKTKKHTNANQMRGDAL